MEKAVVYPGRFQPMLGHHVEVLRHLQSKFPDADVYVGTSDKVEMPKSPFNFQEKQQIAAAHGLNPDQVIQVRQPYVGPQYPFDPDNTILIFAVGEKDAEERFRQGNVDPQTGLNMTVRGEAKPTYIQMLGADDQMLPMSQRAYVYVTPNVTSGGEISSASAFREQLKNAPDLETAKKIYVRQFGEFNPDVFALIYNKLTGNKTMESKQLNEMRKLAGLPIMEAPVAYDMTPEENALAKIGRALMALAETAPPEESVELATVGHELTKYGSTEGARSIEKLLDITGVSVSRMRELLQLGQEAADSGEGHMGISHGDDSEDDFDDSEDDFDDEQMESSEVNLDDIRMDYEIAESDDDDEDALEESDDVNEEMEESEDQAEKDAEEKTDESIDMLRRLAGI